MKRAFDDNVSKAKPRLSLGRALAGVVEADAGQGAKLVPPPPRVEPAPVARFQPVAHPDSPVALDAHAIAARVATEDRAEREAPDAPISNDAATALRAEAPVHGADTRAATVAATPRARAAQPAPAPQVENARAVTVETLAPPVETAAPTPTPAPASKSTPPRADAAPSANDTPAARRERLKERLKRAAHPLAVRDPAPSSAAEAEAAALSMIGQLQEALERAEAENGALRQDLDTARAQLSRAAAEARERTDEAQALVTESARRAELLHDLEGELVALEAERDDALGQLLGARAELETSEVHAAELQRALQAKEDELLEAIGEEERMAAELDARTDEVSTLRGLTTALTTERDALLAQVSTLTRERVELSDARKALESVHRALADARARSQPRR